MPVLVSERIITLEFADLRNRRPIDRPDRPLERHKGWHQSGVLAYIARKVGWLKPGEQLEEELPGRMALGIMFEEFYFSIDHTSVWQPREVVVDEIAMNCDGIGAWEAEDGHEYTVVTETKCTEKKVRGENKEAGETSFLEERIWLYQGMSYLHGYQTGQLVRWIVNYYRGNWCGSGPIIKEHVVWFSLDEIKAAWRMMLKFRNEAEKEY